MSRIAVPALAALILALFPAVAQADPWAITGYQPEAPLAGDVVTFHAGREKGNDPGDSLVWDFGDGEFGTGTDSTHRYAAAGTYTVRLSVAGETDPQAQITIDVAAPPPPPPNTPPSAAFTFSPMNPLVGEGVLFTGGSDPDGDPITRVWDFGDSTPNSSDVQPSHAYAAPGTYTVSLTVTDDRNEFASTSRQLMVSPQPGQGPAGSPPADKTPTPAPRLPGALNPPVPMKPFPVVRIAGVVLPTGALVRILSVRAPRGARTLVRCSGGGCPAATVRRTSSTRLVRFHRFERPLPAGVRLELFVRKTERIGKYTRLLIRAGKAPGRVDRCLMPGAKRPVRCP